jgi:hypothetical protein
MECLDFDMDDDDDSNGDEIDETDDNQTDGSDCDDDEIQLLEVFRLYVELRNQHLVYSYSPYILLPVGTIFMHSQRVVYINITSILATHSYTISTSACTG